MPGLPSPIAFLPELGQRTLVMGILNATPDSFSDGGLFADPADALAQAERMRDEGADIIDIGGESTRPGYERVPAEEEMARVLPLVAAVSRKLGLPVSIDTYKAATAEAALRAGARIVNDVWGLQREPEIASVAASHGAPVIVMHNRETIDPSLDVIDELKRFFARSLDIARRAGIPDAHVVLDPGIGFGKTPAQQLEALRRLPEIKAMGFPVLVGASRKSLIGRLRPGGPGEPRERLFGSLAAHMAAVAGGADILRVHDVAAHVEACRVVDAIRHAA